MRLYSVYCTSVDSSISLRHRHPSSGAHKTVNAAVWAPDDGCRHPKHVELSTEV